MVLAQERGLPKGEGTRELDERRSADYQKESGAESYQRGNGDSGPDPRRKLAKEQTVAGEKASDSGPDDLRRKVAKEHGAPERETAVAGRIGAEHGAPERGTAAAKRTSTGH